MYKISVPTIITNGHFNKEKTLKELKRAGADRVVLALDRELDYEFSSPENLALIKTLIDYYHENGLEVVIWLGETLGHGCEAPFAGSKYTNMRSFESGDISAFCPKDENLIRAIGKWIQNIAEFGPDMIMLDDDFRYHYRGGVTCCCPLHMKALSLELSEDIDEKTLYGKLWDGGRNKYRSAWMKVQGEAMLHYAKSLRSMLDKTAPNVRLGFCSCITWDSEGWNPIEATRLLAGNTEPFIRMAGAPYWVRSEGNTKLAEVVEIVRREIEYFRGSGIEFFAEGDTYPRPREECPASYLECFDMVLRADGGSSGILRYMLDYVSDADYETGYVDAMLKNADIYSAIEKMFAGKRAVGVRPYTVPHLVEDADIKTDSLFFDRTRDVFRQPSLTYTALNSLPVSYEAGGVNILFGENARHIPTDELKNGNIIDITAARLLTERGIDVGIEAFLPDMDYALKGFSALPNEYFIEENNYTRLFLGVNIPTFKPRENARILSNITVLKESTVGAFEYENRNGERFLVLPFDAYEAKRSVGWLYGYARKRQAIKSIEWLGGKPLPAYVDGNFPDMYVMTKKDDKSLAVGIWNMFDDRADGVKIKLSQECKSVKFINCKGRAEGKYVILETPVYPYEFAGLEIEY